MTSERELTKRFNEILDEIVKIAESYVPGANARWRIGRNPERNEFLSKIGKKITELEQIGIDKIKLNESIDNILERVRENIVKILASTKLTETEKQIRLILNEMRGDPERTHPHDYYGSHSSYVGRLKLISVSEEDLIKASERVLKMLEKLVKAAEKLD